MSKRILFVVFIFLCIRFGATAQSTVFKPVTNQAEIEAFKVAMTRETSQVNNIQADFVQTKQLEFLNEAVVSTGILYFASGKRLRWEYEKPHFFIFILNGAKAWMINQGGTTQVDVQSNKMFKELSELMMFGMGGTSLFNHKSFDFSFRTSGTHWEVGLKPKTKEMKALYSQIELLFSLPTYQMESVRMLDVSGDETLIQLKNQKINTRLSDALFTGEK